MNSSFTDYLTSFKNNKSKQSCIFYSSSLSKQKLNNLLISSVAFISSGCSEVKQIVITLKASCSLYPDSNVVLRCRSTNFFNFSFTVDPTSSFIMILFLSGSKEVGVKLFLGLFYCLLFSFIIILVQNHFSGQRVSFMKNDRPLLSWKIRSVLQALSSCLKICKIRCSFVLFLKVKSVPLTTANLSKSALLTL